MQSDRSVRCASDGLVSNISSELIDKSTFVNIRHPLLISFLFLIQASSSLALSPKTDLRLLIAL
jgi:hypothetical protein